MGKKMGKMIGGQLMKNPRAVTGSLVNEMIQSTKIPTASVPIAPKVDVPVMKPKMMPSLSRGKNMFKKGTKV